MIKNDRWIRSQKGMIEPFAEQSNAGVISYGLSSYGYDVRVSNLFKVFTNVFNSIIDPKNFDPACFVDIETDVCIVPPNSFALASTVEYFKIPRRVLTICVGKSTYARCGIIVNVTPFEPEWEGHVTLEISNTTPLPAKIYANEGIAQVLFFESDEECETSYKDKRGKYQGQRGVTLPRISALDLPFFNEACALCGRPCDIHKGPNDPPSGSPNNIWGDVDSCRTFTRCNPRRAAYGELNVNKT